MFLRVAFFDIAMIVGIFLLVLIILEEDFIVALESRIILIGFFPFTCLTVSKGSSRMTVFFPTKMASTLERNL